ncbi:MAG: Fic family protein [Planctomycetes bacterium]|nr:Fic family protein [Planctomycetota bacterium]
MSVSFPDSDPIREYTPEETEQLTRQLVDLTTQLHEGAFSSEPLRPELVHMLHRQLFAGVRSHAGRPRTAQRGAEHLAFGPNRSVHRSKVEAEMTDLFKSLLRSVLSLEDNLDSEGYEGGAIYVATWAHAEVVRIHPFEDGNGRASRSLMNTLLVRLGMNPIAVECVKDEYNESLNHYFRTKDLDPLKDLMIRLYANALEEDADPESC